MLCHVAGDEISHPAMAVRLPSLNGLRAFEAAARHLSFARAAAELGVTRTAVSHQIRRLEEQLDVRLFVRQPEGLALSNEGRAYLSDVRAAFGKLRVATRPQARPRSVVTVSTTPTLAAKWLVPRLPAFNATFPDIEVRIGATMPLVDLARERIDVAIRYGCGHWPGLRCDRLAMTDAFFPVCSPTLMRGRVPLRTPSDLAAHTLLYVEHERYEWRLWLDAAGAEGHVAARGLSFDVAYLALQAAIDGAGVALGYAPYVAADIAAGGWWRRFTCRCHRPRGSTPMWSNPGRLQLTPPCSATGC